MSIGIQIIYWNEIYFSQRVEILQKREQRIEFSKDFHWLCWCVAKSRSSALGGRDSRTRKVHHLMNALSIPPISPAWLSDGPSKPRKVSLHPGQRFIIFLTSFLLWAFFAIVTLTVETAFSDTYFRDEEIMRSLGAVSVLEPIQFPIFESSVTWHKLRQARF